MTTAEHEAAEFAALPEFTAFRRLDGVGVVRLSGRDRLALLHRLSTNQLEKLTAGQGALTALTTPIGRMIDLLRIAVLADDVMAVTGTGRGAQVARHVKRNIFFNDRLTVDDLSATTAVFALLGPQQDELLAQGGAVPGPAAFAVSVVDHDGGRVVIQRGGPAAAASLVIVPAGAAEQWAQLFSAAGARELDEAQWQMLRVERAEAAAPYEISEDFIPLETGLWSAVNFSKGCYVGQEIIARMESRGRIAKQLRAVTLSSLPESLPQELSIDGKDAGLLTSAVLSPRLGPIGLAYIRSAVLDSPIELSFAGGTARQRTDTPATL